MQLSVSSGKHGIIQRATFLAFGSSTDHTTDYPLADMIASANRWVQRTFVWLEKASGIWDVDDKNQTDLPVATTTLVAAQQDYALPSTIIKLKRVEVLNNSGNYVKLTQLDETEIPGALDEFEETDGLPKYYRVESNSVFLYPAPAAGSVTTTAGLKIYYTREYTTFTVPASYTTADTTEPGFDEGLHDIIPLGIAYDWCLTNGPENRAKSLREEIALLQSDLNSHMALKNEERRPRISPSYQSYV